MPTNIISPQFLTPSREKEEKIEKGSKVTNFEIGDLVLMPYWSDVPEGYSSGWGTYSEYNIVTDALAQEKDGIIPAEFAYGQRKLPADFDPVSSSMIITICGSFPTKAGIPLIIPVASAIVIFGACNNSIGIASIKLVINVSTISGSASTIAFILSSLVRPLISPITRSRPAFINKGRLFNKAGIKGK